MGLRVPLIALVPALAAALATSAVAAKKNGFADKPGGGVNDPVIEVSASIGPNQGAIFSLTEAQANALYQFDPASGNFGITVNGALAVPTIPQAAQGANQFLRIKFPFNIHSKKVRKTIFKNSVDTVATSFLTPNVQITDQVGNHIPGIALINGKDVNNVKRTNDIGFPIWLGPKGQSLLAGKKVFTYVATLPTDQDLSSVAAFGADPGTPETVGAVVQEIRVRIDEVNKITINGFWVLKIGDGMGGLKNGGGPVTITDVSAQTPVTPTQNDPNGNQIVESFTRFIVTYSEPVVPQSVGFNASQVQAFNATNPLIPLLFNANSGPVPNPNNLLVPIFPNVSINASPNGITSFQVPFNARPINPNNLSQYILDPILDLPGNVDVTITSIQASLNQNPTSDPNNPTSTSAATSLYNVRFDDGATASTTFHTNEGKAFTNAPVAPQALYFNSLSGTGMGVINLDGNGFETNHPDTERLLLLTNAMQLCNCGTAIALPGTYLLGCNPNTFGDPGVVVNNVPQTPTAPIGLGHNPPGILGGPTPVPGVNEGSSGSTANQANPFAPFPRGFETVVRNSNGNARLARSPQLGSVGDVQVGDFLDTIFFDTLNPFASVGFHASNVIGNPLNRNSISDPPVPNPPPLRLPVGLPPVDVVFSQQNLLEPAFVIEGDEVFTDLGAFMGCGVPGLPAPPGKAFPFSRMRLSLRENPVNPLAGDTFPTFAQNGPAYQTFTSGGTAFASRQQIGNFLYVTDRDEGVVKALNSNTFSVLAKINTPDPEGLGMAPDNRRLYVSNFGDDTVSILGTDPLGAFFHKEINRIKVGTGPRAISVQPDNEDVFVANYLGNSVSIIDPKTQTVRKTLTEATVKRPVEIILTPRQGISGWASGIYFGYIASQTSGQVVVYESGPSGATGIGADAIRWSVQTPLGDVRGMTYDPGTYPGASVGLPTGVYVTHSDPQTGLAMVSRIAFTAQLPGAGPFPPVPPPSSVLNAPGIIQRQFQVVGSWGGPLAPFQQQLNNGGQDQIPADVALSDINATDFFSTAPQVVQTNFGAFNGLQSLAALSINNKSPLRISNGAPLQTIFPDRMYISFPGDNRVVVVDPGANGQKLNTIENVPVVGRLTTYFDQ